ncbi:unnamed protein product [Phytophthora fragariaefolia]|uniref:Unnamed protein product n=1 Tax=Phytophthora fragariaefolia TaxID=1490495 RepID=A0A9W6TP73_9STRA|nr:unnamed protein product [Phytophthora fragariaefolia]
MLLTPKKGKPRGGRYDDLFGASDEAKLGDSRDDSANLRGDRDETVKDQIRRLRYVEAERDSSQYLELRTHFSLANIAELEGKILGRAAKSWYCQLPKKTQQHWSLLSEAYLDYDCSQFVPSARTRYYAAILKVSKPICDFLIRLNGFARTAKIQYGKAGADAADYVE